MSPLSGFVIIGDQYLIMCIYMPLSTIEKGVSRIIIIINTKQAVWLAIGLVYRFENG